MSTNKCMHIFPEIFQRHNNTYINIILHYYITQITRQYLPNTLDSNNNTFKITLKIKNIIITYIICYINKNFLFIFCNVMCFVILEESLLSSSVISQWL